MLRGTGGCRIRDAALPLLCLLLCYAASSRGSVPAVAWDASTPITWALFQAAPPTDATNRTEAAAIHMTIRWHASYSVTSRGNGWTGRVQTVAVSNTMEPSLSWVVLGRATDQILRHEQGHFDLNEVYRRKLEILLPCIQAQGVTQEGVIDALDGSLHQRAADVLGRLQILQDRYDAESGHGNSAAGQARWESHIAAWLLDPATAP